MREPSQPHAYARSGQVVPTARPSHLRRTHDRARLCLQTLSCSACHQKPNSCGNQGAIRGYNRGGRVYGNTARRLQRGVPPNVALSRYCALRGLTPHRTNTHARAHGDRLGPTHPTHLRRTHNRARLCLQTLSCSACHQKHNSCGNQGAIRGCNRGDGIRGNLHTTHTHVRIGYTRERARTCTACHQKLNSCGKHVYWHGRGSYRSVVGDGAEGACRGSACLASGGAAGLGGRAASLWSRRGARCGVGESGCT